MLSKEKNVFNINLYEGLKADDLRMEENQDVATAVSRLPAEAQYQRIFRLKRAMDLSLKHQLLPREQWTKPEEVCTIILAKINVIGYVFLYIFLTNCSNIVNDKIRT